MNKVLIVDPTDYSAELISKLLIRNGYDAITISSSVGLMINIKVFKPDLLIIDTELITESGYDLCKRLKANDETKYIPVLLMGVIETNSILTKAFEAGADDFIPKTFESYILISKVRSLMRIKALSDELKNKYIELEEKDRMIDLQLKMAVQVQRSLIYDLDLNIDDVQFYSKYIPALEIGGDFYDIVQLNDDSVCVVMGDVSGHGISAALLTAMLNMMIRTLAPKYFNPAQFLFHMNNELYKIFENGNTSIYACMFYAIIDIPKKCIYYSNAGQALPIFVDNINKNAFELESFGTPIGMIKDAIYEHRIQKFEKGDVLLFFTDGLADNIYKDNADEFYKRLTSMLVDMGEDTPAAIMAESLLSVFARMEVQGSQKYSLDDVSIIVCKM